MKPQRMQQVLQQNTSNVFNYNFSGQSYNMEDTTLYPAPHMDLTVFLFFYIDDIEFSVLKDPPYTSLNGLNSMSL